MVIQVREVVSQNHLHLQQKLVQADQFSPLYSFPSASTPVKKASPETRPKTMQVHP